MAVRLDDRLARALANAGRRGDVLVSQSKPKPALASFERALTIARHQQARSWEQRILASQAALSSVNR